LIGTCRYSGLSSLEKVVLTTPLNTTVLKAFAILDLFDDGRSEVTTQDVVAAAGLNTVTAHRFLKTLVHVGALTSPYKGVYRLGLKLVDYGKRADDTRRLAILLQPYLNTLAEETSEAAMATVFDGSMAVCLAVAHSHRFLTFTSRVGARHEAYSTANGKLWLAHLPEAELSNYFATHNLVPFSERTRVERIKLEEEFAVIRGRGYATNRGERERGLAAVAVPLFSPQKTMVAGISVFGPEERITPLGDEKIAATLRRVIKNAQTALDRGYRY
jgi:DNA-binding IclR family transcriptional regulator